MGVAVKNAPVVSSTVVTSSLVNKTSNKREENNEIYLRPTSVTWKQPDKFKDWSLNTARVCSLVEWRWRLEVELSLDFTQSSIAGSWGFSLLQVEWQLRVSPFTISDFREEDVVDVWPVSMFVPLLTCDSPPPRNVLDMSRSSHVTDTTFVAFFLHEICRLSSHESSMLWWHSWK